jgi:hypothetical protein
MHWTLPQVHALTTRQHAELVRWLTEQQEERQAAEITGGGEG